MSCSPRFLADVMLGTLAKWLRILGYDTAYDNAIEDDRLLELSRQEARILLTRDRRLARRREAPGCLLIESDDLGDQLCQVLAFLGATIDPARVLTRCLECNLRLQEIERPQARSRVPAYVFRTQSSFHCCPACGRIYWRGTHRSRIFARLAELTGQPPGEQPREDACNPLIS